MIENEVREAVGRAVRKARLGMDYTQTSLARTARIDVKTLRSLEDGERWPCDVSRSRIEGALKWPTGSLDLIAAGRPVPQPTNSERSNMTNDLAHENYRINTPWDELDEALDGGLQRGKVYLLRGHGKTTAALNIASAAAAQSVGVALYEWEMHGPEVQRRMAANFNRVPIAEVGTQELEAVRPFAIRIPSDYTDRIEVHEDEGLLVIDYLDYIPSFEDNPHQVLRSLKSRAREQNIAVVAVAHLQAPDLYRHVDAVVHMKPIVRPEYPGMLTGEVTISLVKNRTGRPDLSFEAPWFRDQSRIGGTVSRRITDQG